MGSKVGLLLIGKTGNGKSALGNTILRRNSFISSSSPSSCTKTTSCQTYEFQGRVINVVDTPGIDDTQTDKEASLMKISHWATNAFSVNPSGFHALLLVLKVTNRFTREEQDTITLLKNIFGGNFVSDHCIIVMTCGDVYEKEKKLTGLSFEQWCANQRGPFRDLVGECGNRIVLFDNFVKDKEAKEKQLGYLLHLVDRLTATRNKYTEINFSKAKEARERMLREAKLQEMFGPAMKELGLIISLLKSIEDCEDGATRLKVIAAARQRAEALCKSSGRWDFPPGKVNDVFKIASSVKAIIWDQLIQEERLREGGKCDEKWFTRFEPENPRQKTASILEQTLHELEEQHEKIWLTIS